VLVSLCGVALRWLLEFAALRARSKEFQELEIIVLRRELAILRRTTRRPAITAVDACYSPLPADCCRARLGNRSSLRRRRCCAGIAVWSPSGGRTRVPSVVRRAGVRLGTWCCGLRERTRSGAIPGLSAN
jgi:hypothetical protein